MRSVKNQETIEAMKDAAQQFLTGSVILYIVLALTISDQNARRVLKFSSKIHPYKMF